MVHGFLAQDDRKKVVVGDVLKLGPNDPPGLLVSLLVIPVRVDLRKFPEKIQGNSYYVWIRLKLKI